MIQHNTSSLCIIEANGDMTITSRYTKMVSVLNDWHIDYSKKTIKEINDMIEGVPGNGYLDYNIYETIEPVETDLYYPNDIEALVVTTGSAEYTILLDGKKAVVNVRAGDYITIPKNMKRRFKTDGKFAAIRFLTQANSDFSSSITRLT